MIINAYGILNISPTQLMRVLDSLNVGYSACGITAQKKFWHRQVVKGKQPAWIVVADTVNAALRIPNLSTDYILFICDSEVSLKSNLT